ncbi:hypothetical protein EON65_56920 [archaeon]|nr:MAG: hypothetical protein EON65_56920 [archaeon]
MDLQASLLNLFGQQQDGKIADQSLKELCQRAWMGKMTSEDGLRALTWRVLLGLLDPKDTDNWASILQQYSEKYEKLKHEVRVAFELSALCIAIHR